MPEPAPGPPAAAGVNQPQGRFQRGNKDAFNRDDQGGGTREDRPSIGHSPQKDREGIQNDPS